MKFKKFEDLTFSDDFIFGKVLTGNMELCRELLELILNKKIGAVKIAESQKTIKQTYDSKGIRLDVYVEDEDAVYDIEMQTTFQKDLPKRTRYYQGIIDLNLIESGADYSELRQSYIIFICTSDPFGENLPVYTFKNICVEKNSLELKDEAVKVVINAAGCRDGLSQNMAAFLDFLQSQKVSDDFTEKLSDEVLRVKSSKDWRQDYMKLETMLMDARRDGREEERKKNLFSSVCMMIDEGFSIDKIRSVMLNRYGATIDETNNYIKQAKKSK